MIFNMPCTEFLDHAKPAAMIFADPPDNIGLDYDGYTDSRPDYYEWLELVILKSLRLTPIFWLSYYWQHDLEIKYRIRNILKYRHPAYEAKTYIWRFTFGQHNEYDCGSGYRPIIRIARRNATYNTDDIRVQSWRQKHGDPRANPAGRVPDDVWDYPRVVGNAKERRTWHKTQHPEALIERIILLSTQRGDLCYDLFGGSGTTLRCCRNLGRDCHTCDISPNYCLRMACENGCKVSVVPPS